MEVSYNEFNKFLDSSLVILDDFMPEYTIFEQFSGMALLVPAQAAVIDSLKGVGKTYLSYLNDSQLAPRSIYAPNLRKQNQNLFSNILMDPICKNQIKNDIKKQDMHHLFPFMVTKEAEVFAKEVGLKLITTERISREVNSKINSKLLATSLGVPSVPGTYSKANNNFLNETKELLEHHGKIMLKDDYSCGGIGNQIITNREVLEKFIRGHKERNYLAEVFIEATSVPCVLFFISEAGRVDFLGITEQVIKDSTKYTGTLYPNRLGNSLQTKLLRYAQKICKELYNQYNYSGVVGLDFIVSDDTIYFLEANCRINNSTIPMYIIHNKLLNSKVLLKMVYFSPKHTVRSFDEFMRSTSVPLLNQSTNEGMLLNGPMMEGDRLKRFSLCLFAKNKEKIESFENTINKEVGNIE